MIPAQLDQPWDQTLTRTVELAIEPGVTLTGRVVRDGVPVPDVTMKLHKSPPPNPGKTATRYMVFSETKTDAEGRYWISGLKPGERYRFEVIAPGNLQVRDWPHQSPYLQSVKAMDGETVVLPDAELVSSGQQLSGIVVDPTGNAIPDVQVSARLTSGRTLARPLRGPPPWARTDSNGRFTIANLPDEPVRLMAHRSNPGGGIIQYPAYALPPLNAQDIRIVLDTRLGSEIEDLDAD